MLKTFPIGGVHPSECKFSRDAAICPMPLPQTVIIPMAQHIGAPAMPVVKKGDRVVVGQLIGRGETFVSSNIHSSVSGLVTAVDMYQGPQSRRWMSVAIKVEGDEWSSDIDRSPKIVRECELGPAEIIKKITDAGIVGMGGATFPTHVKLTIPPGSKAEYLIINGVECEPYLTADHRVMLERGEEVLIGVELLARALGVEKAFVGIENNKQDAIEHLGRLAEKFEGIEIVPLKVQYPQGGEKQLIAAVTGRRVPSGALPIAVNCVVQNVATALAVYEAVQKNKPLIERVVTVTGRNVAKPANLLVRIGTPMSEVVEFAGGVPEGTAKIVGGGPMMGRAISNVEAPITKGSSGILMFDHAEAVREPEGSCIKCGKCVEACPMGLEPYLLNVLARKRRWEDCEINDAADCIECGSCSFTCPAHLALLDYIRLGKSEVQKAIRARSAKK